MKKTKKEKLARRHMRVRSKVAGSTERPRLYVRKSLKHIHVQLIDDTPENGSITLLAMTTLSKETAGKHCCNVANATELGKKVGAELKNRGIDKIVYDRGGNIYHGCVKALADAVRETGIQF